MSFNHRKAGGEATAWSDPPEAIEARPDVTHCCWLWAVIKSGGFISRREEANWARGPKEVRARRYFLNSMLMGRPNTAG